jgi:adenylate cyclase
LGLVQSFSSRKFSVDELHHEAVSKQLGHLLAHPAFSCAPRLSSLLRYIVQETLAGRGKELKEYTLGVAVLGRGSQFDPRLDSIVRVQASKLRARLTAYYKDAGVNDAILIELPPGSYEPRIIPHGSKVEVPRQAGTVAVLPFANLGPEPDTEYLSNGLAEEIIDRLGSIPGLRVVARTSAFQFKDKGGNIREIGRALGAQYLIEGAIRKSQDRFRVNARLIDASTGYQVWSHAYDDTPGDLFSLQTAIADAIGEALGGGNSRSPADAVVNGVPSDAYHLYLRGRFHRNQWTLQGCEKSIECFERALGLARNSAQILAALSEAEVLRTIVAAIPAARHMDSARAAAEQAIAIDNRCAQAHLSLGWIHHIYDWHWDSGLAEFERALAVNPSLAEAWHLKGLFLALRQRATEADESFKRALELDPLSLVIQSHAALVPYFADRLEQAESLAQAARATEPNFAEAHWVLGWIYERQERYLEALDSFRMAVQFGGENPTILGDIAFLHTRLEDSAPALEIIARLKTGFPRPHPAASSLARVYLGLGERAKANAWLAEAFEARDLMLPWACADRRYQNMWALPAFSGFRERILGPLAR